MNKVRFHYGYPIQIDIATDKQVDVYIDQYETSAVPTGQIRIVVQEDPFARRQHIAYAQEHREAYTYLLTFYEELLASIPNAVCWNMPTTWITDYTFPQKSFSVSTVVGGKSNPSMRGYRLRHDVWDARQQIRIPRRFYLSGTSPFRHRFVPWTKVSYKGELVLGASKDPLFDSMFHIAIENTAIRNYFSEKLLDCFQTRTVPVYCGCTNLGDWFNMEGVITFSTVRELVQKCNGLTEKTYEKMSVAIEDNYLRSFMWIRPFDRLACKIKELIQ